MATRRYPLQGEVDMANAPILESKLMVLVNATNDDLVVDCARLEFIDSSGIHVLLAVRELLEARNRELRIENLTGTPRRAFEILGLLEGVDVGEPEPA